MKAIKTQVRNIQEIERNWQLIKQYESNGDLKSIEANGSRRHVTKHELKSWKKLGFGIRIISKIKKTHLLLMLPKKPELIFLNPWDGCQMWMGYFIFSLLLLLLNLHYSTIFLCSLQTIWYSLVSLLFWLF
jgi:hypothetical protein